MLLLYLYNEKVMYIETKSKNKKLSPVIISSHSLGKGRCVKKSPIKKRISDFLNAYNIKIYNILLVLKFWR
jgi:hypothetical protein